MDTPDVITKLITKTGLSARALSRELNLSENAIGYYLNRKRKPSLQNCYRIIAYAKKHRVKIKLEDLLSV